MSLQLTSLGVVVESEALKGFPSGESTQKAAQCEPGVTSRATMTCPRASQRGMVNIEGRPIMGSKLSRRGIFGTTWSSLSRSKTGVCLDSGRHEEENHHRGQETKTTGTQNKGINLRRLVCSSTSGFMTASAICTTVMWWGPRQRGMQARRPQIRQRASSTPWGAQDDCCSRPCRPVLQRNRRDQQDPNSH